MSKKEKTCDFWAHFFQTEMAQSMENGNLGYSMLIQNVDSIGVPKNKQGIRVAKPSAIKIKIDTYGEFEKDYR